MSELDNLYSETAWIPEIFLWMPPFGEKSSEKTRDELATRPEENRPAKSYAVCFPVFIVASFVLSRYDILPNVMETSPASMAHSERFRKVSNRYPRRVAEAYGGDIARAATDDDATVAATVAAWERSRGLAVEDWTAIGHAEGRDAGCVCAVRGYCADVAGDPLACPVCVVLGDGDPCPAGLLFVQWARGQDR